MELLEHKSRKEIPIVEMKTFKSKHGLPKPDDYGKEPPHGFWDKVKTATWDEVKEIRGGIDGDKLRKLAIEAG